MTRVLSLLSLLFMGAIFGFFYAWICSTLWGLDMIDPRIAIAAMQAMNASVRNIVFFPAFFLTPVVLAITAAACAHVGSRSAAACFALAAVVYVVGAMLPTMFINVPMNEALAATIVPESRSAAAAIWSDYSTKWQFWNQLRTVFSAIALLLVGMGLQRNPRSTKQEPEDPARAASGRAG